MEAIPFIGLIFSVSNRIGAAMWAHGMSLLSSGSHCSLVDRLTGTMIDLEKKQHWVAEERAKKGQ